MLKWYHFCIQCNFNSPKPPVLFMILLYKFLKKKERYCIKM